MKHTFELRLPKFLDRKLNVSPEEEAAMIEETKEKVSKAVRIGGPILIGATIGYLVGYNRGAGALGKHGGDLYIIK